ncbi:hypothetical protein [Streptomyces sp. NPDC050704]|uniref:hypothetical protein n=1 Tax=Streptomyces sp. NPDC050704 TaxID=3157219 RepID=UPI0034319FFB
MGPRLGADLAGCRTGEVTLVGRLPRSCGADQLVLGDREFLGVPLWRAFAATGARLLWRVPASRILPVDRQLRDGSWLPRIHAGSDPGHTDPVTVRVLAHQLGGTGRATVDCRLVAGGRVTGIPWVSDSGQWSGPEPQTALAQPLTAELTWRLLFRQTLRIPGIVASIMANVILY